MTSAYLVGSRMGYQVPSVSAVEVLLRLVLMGMSALLVTVSTCIAEGDLRITFLDVGEGDATVLQAPSGETLVVDAGNLITGTRVVKFMRNISTINLSVIFTHPHPDHIGGAFSLLQEFSPKLVYDNGENLAAKSTDEDLFRWYGQLVRAQSPYRALRKGDKLRLGDVAIQVLSPSVMTNDWNTNSIVLLVAYGEFRALLMGDGNVNTEESLLSAGVVRPVRVLKAGHHGAADTASVEFLKQLQPKLVTVSVNTANIRGYPSRNTLERYTEAGAKVVLTSAGDIEVTARKDGTFEFVQHNS